MSLAEFAPTGMPRTSSTYDKIERSCHKPRMGRPLVQWSRWDLHPGPADARRRRTLHRPLVDPKGLEPSPAPLLARFTALRPPMEAQDHKV